MELLDLQWYYGAEYPLFCQQHPLERSSARTEVGDTCTVRQWPRTRSTTTHPRRQRARQRETNVYADWRKYWRWGKSPRETRLRGLWSPSLCPRSFYIICDLRSLRAA